MRSTVDRRTVTIALTAALAPAVAVHRPRLIEAQESSPTASPIASPSPVAGANVVEVGAHDIALDPKAVTINADTATTFEVQNHRERSRF